MSGFELAGFIVMVLVGLGVGGLITAAVSETLHDDLFSSFVLVFAYTGFVVIITAWSGKLISTPAPKSVMAAEAVPASGTPPAPRPIVASCRCS